MIIISIYVNKGFWGFFYLKKKPNNKYFPWTLPSQFGFLIIDPNLVFLSLMYEYFFTSVGKPNFPLTKNMRWVRVQLSDLLYGNPLMILKRLEMSNGFMHMNAVEEGWVLQRRS